MTTAESIDVGVDVNCTHIKDKIQKFWVLLDFLCERGYSSISIPLVLSMPGECTKIMAKNLPSNSNGSIHLS